MSWSEWILWTYIVGFSVQMITSWIWLIFPGRNRSVAAPEDYLFMAVFWPIAIFGGLTAPGQIGVEDGGDE